MSSRVSSRRLFVSLGCVLAAALCAAFAPARAASDAARETESAPRRIVSLNMCTDELVLRLAPLSRIASVTWLSQDPQTANVAALARRVPANHGLAEEVVPLDPDLVMAGSFAARTAVALLKATGLRVVEFGDANDMPAVRARIRDMAQVLHAQARGEALVTEFDHALAAAQVQDNSVPRLTALVFNPNGATASAGSLLDDILTRAGLENIAAHLDLGPYHEVPLETLVTQHPDLLVVSAAREGPPSLATEVLRHPVLAQLATRTQIVVMPSRLWTCPGPAAVEAIARLRSAADDIRRARAVR